MYIHYNTTEYRASVRMILVLSHWRAMHPEHPDPDAESMWMRQPGIINFSILPPHQSHEAPVRQRAALPHIAVLDTSGRGIFRMQRCHTKSIISFYYYKKVKRNWTFISICYNHITIYNKKS